VVPELRGGGFPWSFWMDEKSHSTSPSPTMHN
jgi:hypothetical protein